ncbi:uncharacterized protein EAF02_002188 [Botrytis sinoallii]|uniref:uncharacterized protein n=1 Tax=Botrytis sinoallii TaxID=1463999 RepID=UPI0018FF632E|nr:uncharacterized protein EAF02_002188 [Botrytis sinoallii]KAF7889773.1 hypothetical protein EAF02_002188 [Botrytis sinoallii]
MAQNSDANYGQQASILIASKHAIQLSKICPGADVQVLGLIESGPSLVADDARVLRFFSNEVFSITKKSSDFAHIVARNISLDIEDTDLQAILKENDQGVFVEIADSPRLYLEEDVFFRPDCLIGPGTVCFKARAAHTRGQDLVVKFVWTETGSAGEKNYLHLQIARRLLAFSSSKRTGIWGILLVFNIGKDYNSANLTNFI